MTGRDLTRSSLSSCGARAMTFATFPSPPDTRPLGLRGTPRENLDRRAIPPEPAATFSPRSFDRLLTPSARAARGYGSADMAAAEGRSPLDLRLGHRGTPARSASMSVRATSPTGRMDGRGYGDGRELTATLRVPRPSRTLELPQKDHKPGSSPPALRCGTPGPPCLSARWSPGDAPLEGTTGAPPPRERAGRFR